MLDYASDVEVTRFLTFPPATDISFVVEFLERCEQVWLDGSAFPWGSLGIPYPILVVGTSQGGSIGACFAAEHPGTVNKLALLSPFFDDFEGSRGAAAVLFKTPLVGDLALQLVPDSKIADLSGKVLSADKKADLEREVAQQFRFRGKRRAILANWRGGTLDDATSCYEGVRDQGIPTLLTWGTLDQNPGDSMSRLRDLLPGIEHHEFEGAGHLAHYEFSDLINPPLIRFLAG